jgi:membrane associated rhomboid family serine protease
VCWWLLPGTPAFAHWMNDAEGRVYGADATRLPFVKSRRTCDVLGGCSQTRLPVTFSFPSTGCLHSGTYSGGKTITRSKCGIKFLECPGELHLGAYHVGMFVRGQRSWKVHAPQQQREQSVIAAFVQGARTSAEHASSAESTCLRVRQGRRLAHSVERSSDSVDSRLVVDQSPLWRASELQSGSKPPPRRPGSCWTCLAEPPPEPDFGGWGHLSRSLAQVRVYVSGLESLRALVSRADPSGLPLRARRNALRRSQYPGRPYRLHEHPQVTDWLAAITILSFLLQLWAGPAYVMAGAKVNAAIRTGEWYRLFTPLFLHGNTLHLIVNLSSLKSLGPQIEATYGHKRYAALYLLSGLTGNLFSFFFNTAPSVGASSAIFGLIGAMAAFYVSNTDWFGREHSHRVLRNIAWVTLLNLGQGLAPASRIDNFGHLGGLLGGAVFGVLFGPRLYLDPKGRLVDIPLAQGWLQRLRRRRYR